MTSPACPATATRSTSIRVAGQTPFRRHVAHGMLSAAYVSSMIGRSFRSRSAVDQLGVQFLVPVLVGDEVAFVVRSSTSQATRTLIVSVRATKISTGTLVERTRQSHGSRKQNDGPIAILSPGTGRADDRASRGSAATALALGRLAIRSCELS
jgi:hypothetical protein